MASFLTRDEVNAEISKIIKNANKHIVLITPYLKINEELHERLFMAGKKGVKIAIIYGKKDLAAKEIDKINALLNFTVYYHDRLHSKCYFNEKTAVVTSMNLHEFSMNNNREFGILIDESADSKIYKDIVDEYKSLITVAENMMLEEDDSQENNVGRCIRCGIDIEFNPEKPMCYKCYKNWSEYSNIDYPEKFCHDCGSNTKTSIAKPICLKCYRKNN